MTDKRNMSERMEWAVLPEILLPTIGKCIDTHIDNLRFRSVCTLWRSSIPPFDSISRRRFPLDFPNLFPFPFPELLLDPEEADHYETFLTLFEIKLTLHQSILYRLQRVHPLPSDKAWLIKVEDRKLCLFDPLSAHRQRYELPNNFNLLDFQHLELTRAYSLEIEPNLIQFGSVNKVVMYPNSPSINLNDSHVFVIYNEGKLGHAKCGDESWTSVGEDRKDFDDVIVYEGRFYVVDRFGIVYWINVSSLGLQQFYPRISYGDHELGTKKYLVESGGALYVVDKYDIGRVRFKVYKLNEESDGSSVWDLMESLSDRAFILGRGCSLSVSAGEFFGYEGNCIYFTHQNQTHVFKLEDDSNANVDI
ncbi:F-box protein At4g35733-like [Castanea sativa]|uniref:F-box protein At4g35733-like n=1 Tax=Castanea sativa TaxID=21020 RepID=UPI003F64DF43